MIFRLGGRKLHAAEIRRRTRDILDNPDYATYRQGLLLEQIEGEVGDLHNYLRTLLAAFVPVGITSDPLPVAVAEVGVLYPPDMFTDVGEFAREVALFDRHLRTVAEIAGPGRSPKVAKLQTNSFDVFVWTDLITGAKFIAVVFGVLRAWREIEEIRKLRAETKKLSAEADETLERLEQQRRESTRSALVEQLTSDIRTADEGRKNELNTAAQHVVEYVEQRLAMNVTFEVRPGPALGSKDDKETSAEERASVEASLEALKQISEAGHVMTALDLKTPIALLSASNDKRGA